MFFRRDKQTDGDMVGGGTAMDVKKNSCRVGDRIAIVWIVYIS